MFYKIKNLQSLPAGRQGYPAFPDSWGGCDVLPLPVYSRIIYSSMIDIVIEARNAAISKSMKVKRILPFRLRRMVGPFIFMDHAGPVDIPSQPSQLDVLPHPHIGLSTVSYLSADR
jgi:hypothetical protein